MNLQNLADLLEEFVTARGEEADAMFRAFLADVGLTGARLYPDSPEA